MKRSVAVFVCALAVAACSSRKRASLDGWYEGASGYQRAIAEQKTSGKPVLVYFHTNWCGWCSKLERDVLTTDAFRERYGSALKVRINPEENRDSAALSSQYGVHGFPTMYVIANGESRKPIVGYYPADEYIAALHTAAGD